MLELERIKGILKKHQEFLNEKYFVKSIGIFGSVSKGLETLNSDVDILVEIDGPIGWDFVELKEYLEELIERKVDLISIKALKPKTKSEILNEVVYI